MVTNNKSDWGELNGLVTRCVTLHKITDTQAEGQLTEEPITLENQATVEQQKQIIRTDTFQNNSQNILSIFQQQFWFEILQLSRTPDFLFATLVLSAFVPLFKFCHFGEKQLIQTVVYFCATILFTIVIDRLGKRIAVERSEKWLKLLKVTPLPPTVYMAAKIATSLLLCSVSLLIVFALGSWQLDIKMGFGQQITLVSSLILGIVPFAILGLALGYLLDPKSADSIISLSIIVIPVACGSLPIPGAQIFQDLIALSPFYHYRGLVFAAANLEQNNQIFLHLLWLIWAWGVFSLLAAWSYQRESVVQ